MPSTQERGGGENTAAAQRNGTSLTSQQRSTRCAGFVATVPRPNLPLCIADINRNKVRFDESRDDTVDERSPRQFNDNNRPTICRLGELPMVEEYNFLYGHENM